MSDKLSADTMKDMLAMLYKQKPEILTQVFELDSLDQLQPFEGAVQTYLKAGWPEINFTTFKEQWREISDAGEIASATQQAVPMSEQGSVATKPAALADDVTKLTGNDLRAQLKERLFAAFKSGDTSITPEMFEQMMASKNFQFVPEGVQKILRGGRPLSKTMTPIVRALNTGKGSPKATTRQLEAVLQAWLGLEAQPKVLSQVLTETLGSNAKLSPALAESMIRRGIQKTTGGPVPSELEPILQKYLGTMSEVEIPAINKIVRQMTDMAPRLALEAEKKLEGGIFEELKRADPLAAEEDFRSIVQRLKGAMPGETPRMPSVTPLYEGVDLIDFNNTADRLQIEELAKAASVQDAVQYGTGVGKKVHPFIRSVDEAEPLQRRVRAALLQDHRAAVRDQKVLRAAGSLEGPVPDELAIVPRPLSAAEQAANFERNAAEKAIRDAAVRSQMNPEEAVAKWRASSTPAAAPTENWFKTGLKHILKNPVRDLAIGEAIFTPIELGMEAYSGRSERRAFAHESEMARQLKYGPLGDDGKYKMGATVEEASRAIIAQRRLQEIDNLYQQAQSDPPIQAPEQLGMSPDAFKNLAAGSSML